MRSPELRVQPGPGVRIVGGKWVRDEWNVAVPSPIVLVTAGTGEQELAVVQLAVSYGMATVRPAGGWWRFALDPLVLPTEPVELGDSVARFLSSAAFAFVRIHWPLVVMVAGVLLAAEIAGSAVVVTGAVLVLLLLCSVFAHELGHVIAFRIAAKGGQRAVLVINRSSAWLVHPILARRAEVVVALSGPAAPAVLSVLALPMIGSTPAIGVGLAIMSVGHLLTLALPMGDGAVLRGSTAAQTRGSSQTFF